jgi:hypothetical protein
MLCFIKNAAKSLSESTYEFIMSFLFGTIGTWLALNPLHLIDGNRAIRLLLMSRRI